jgi:hypothetical protein
MQRASRGIGFHGGVTGKSPKNLKRIVIPKSALLREESAVFGAGSKQIPRR